MTKYIYIYVIISLRDGYSLIHKKKKKNLLTKYNFYSF